MDELEEFTLINELFDEYGSLLSDSQYQMMEQYYVFNLSLSEIADSFNISRTAVNDAIKKGVVKCKQYELKMRNVENKKKIIEIMNDNNLSKDEMIAKIKGVI